MTAIDRLTTEELQLLLEQKDKYYTALIKLIELWEDK